MTISIARLGFFCVALFVWGCASSSQIRDFTFIPSTEEAFPEVQEARLYKSGLGQPHRVIGEVRILGKPDEGQESLEKRLLEEARKVGAQGVVVLKTGQTVLDVGRAGIRRELVGGASSAKETPLYPPPIAIEEERIYIGGLAIRFIGT